MPESASSSLSFTFADFAANYGPLLVAGAIVISAIIGASVAVLAIMQQRAIARKRAIIEALLTKNWDRDYIEIRRKFVKLRENKDAILDAAKVGNQAGEDASAIRSILNDYEITALGIKRDILDERIFKLWFKTNFLVDHEKMRPFIEVIRQRNPRAFVELEELSDKWRGEPD